MLEAEKGTNRVKTKKFADGLKEATGSLATLASIPPPLRAGSLITKEERNLRLRPHSNVEDRAMNHDAREMTDEEVIQAQIDAGELDYINQRIAMREFAPIEAELDAALGAYMAGLDDPEAKAAALERFDAALIRLREVYRKHDYQWNEYVKDPHLFRGFL
jgi:hypothetical protein